MSWLKKLMGGLDYATGRFEAFPVEDEDTFAEAMKVLDTVRRHELNRVVGASVLDSAAFAGRNVEGVLYACRDGRSGRIVGCGRATPAEQLIGVEASRREYRLDTIEAALVGRTSIGTRLAVLPELRSSPAALVISQALYLEGLHQGYELFLHSCEPGLYDAYLRMGFRPMGPVHASPKGGFRLPMALLCHDFEHLKRVRSPLLSQWKRAGVPQQRDGIRWYAALEEREGGISTGVSPFSDDGELTAALTDGLSEGGKRELLLRAKSIRCEPGQLVLAEDDGGRAMAFVEHGAVQVEVGGKVVAILGEGELFGELAFVLGARRSANVLAAGRDTRIVMLSQRAVNRMSDPADREQLWRNLATVLARRLIQMNQGLLRDSTPADGARDGREQQG